ncbi:MAG: hypothetical protein HC765_00250 [Brachymonas sp.]|nr:hypothetical protein [Brachymonas sp.]
MTDPTNRGSQPHGKQSLEPGGIVYTAVFGGFSDKTLSDRICDAGARVIVTSWLISMRTLAQTPSGSPLAPAARAMPAKTESCWVFSSAWPSNASEQSSATIPSAWSAARWKSAGATANPIEFSANFVASC